MLKPLGDRVVIELVKSEEKTASGIVLPDSAKEKPQEGKIVAVGTGRVLESGERVALEVAAGDLRETEEQNAAPDGNNGEGPAGSAFGCDGDDDGFGCRFGRAHRSGGARHGRSDFP